MESEFEVMRKRIRELRETAGLSQNRLGKLAGIQQASINRYEHGQAVPSPKALLWYAEYFDVSLDYLFGRTGMTEIMPVPRKIILLSYQQGAKVLIFLIFNICRTGEETSPA